ncbi:excisionase [Arthrobacter sp. MYb227]|uniref:helix-turn-helix transcriptional regulator n=1 Tax=Arthrobacter sp. MYb227 TaxID=1848601 RepID=UPI000CFAA5D0|nr:excisionase [Arthrobacter sp. MYb227]PQZ91680.1 excisionase [Arthrobacter sp. MYb227]
MSEDLLNATQLAEKIGSTVGTLAYWRYVGQGPKFIKLGRLVRYRLADVDTWLNDQTRSQTGEVWSA